MHVWSPYYMSLAPAVCMGSSVQLLQSQPGSAYKQLSGILPCHTSGMIALVREAITVCPAAPRHVAIQQHMLPFGCHHLPNPRTKVLHSGKMVRDYSYTMVKELSHHSLNCTGNILYAIYKSASPQERVAMLERL